MVYSKKMANLSIVLSLFAFCLIMDFTITGTAAQQSQAGSDLPSQGSSIANGATATQQDSERVNRINGGLTNIFGGLRQGSLEQILRGSFMFSRNENVQNVAKNVLDAVFRPQQRGSGSS